MKIHTLHLEPGQDLLTEIEKLAKDRGMRSGCLLSAIGSVERLHVKLNNGDDEQEWPEQHEVVSLTGFVSAERCHVHVAGANREGTVRGGHLLAGNPVSLLVDLAVGEF